MAAYYLSRDGRQLGPFSESELRNMLKTGQASPSDNGCLVGSGEWQPLISLPAFATQGSPSSVDSAVAAVIPYKNPPALVGYYLGVFSMIPCFGLILAIPALILGYIGLSKAKLAPGSKGKVHAWTAIILGSIALLLWGGLGILALVSRAGRTH